MNEKIAESLFFQKNQMRKVMKKLRLAQDSTLAEYKSALAANALAFSSVWQNAQTVAMYAPLPGEMSTWPIMARAWKENKTVLLPRIVDASMKKMIFCVCQGKNELQRDSFGILTPSGPPATRKPELMLVPGLAFDGHGCRLGYGGGYYDRFLAEYDECLLTGLCFSFQIIGSVPHDRLDIPVRSLCSEDGYICL